MGLKVTHFAFGQDAFDQRVRGGWWCLPGRIPREFDSELTIRRPNGRSFQNVLEFTDIAGPAVVLQLLYVGERESHSSIPQLAGKAFEELFCQQRDILGAVAEWGDFNGEDAQPIVQILTEAACVGFFSQLAVRRRDHAYIDSASTLITDPFEFTLLQNA